MSQTATENLTCDCCGGKMPPRGIWEANREHAGECSGAVTADGRCFAFEADELWTVSHTYTVHTDGFLYDDFEASNLDEAIEEAFLGEISGVEDLASLKRKFARFVPDGGWCYAEEDGVRVVEIGEVP